MAPIATAASTEAALWPIMMLSQGIFTIIDISSHPGLGQKYQEFRLQLEENRKTFQREVYEKTAELQREIARLNHNLRLAEQKRAFEDAMRQIQRQHFLQNWP